MVSRRNLGQRKKGKWAGGLSEGLSLERMGEELCPKMESREVLKTRARRESRM